MLKIKHEEFISRAFEKSLINTTIHAVKHNAFTCLGTMYPRVSSSKLLDTTFVEVSTPKDKAPFTHQAFAYHIKEGSIWSSH